MRFARLRTSSSACSATIRSTPLLDSPARETSGPRRLDEATGPWRGDSALDVYWFWIGAHEAYNHVLARGK